MSARGAYKEWKESREKIASKQMYFYYGARERLAALDSAWTPALSLAGLGLQVPVPGAEGATNVSESQSDIEHEAQEFMEENEPLLDEGGFDTLHKMLLQGLRISKDLKEETEAAGNTFAAATRALTEAIKNPTTRPRKVFELERERDRLKPTYERKNRMSEEFSAFIDRAKAAYKQRGGEIT
jgi:hypothetical protein